MHRYPAGDYYPDSPNAPILYPLAIAKITLIITLPSASPLRHSREAPRKAFISRLAFDTTFGHGILGLPSALGMNIPTSFHLFLLTSAAMPDLGTWAVHRQIHGNTLEPSSQPRFHLNICLYYGFFDFNFTSDWPSSYTPFRSGRHPKQRQLATFSSPWAPPSFLSPTCWGP